VAAAVAPREQPLAVGTELDLAEPDEVLDVLPVAGVPNLDPGAFVEPMTAGGDPTAVGADGGEADVFLRSQPQHALVVSVQDDGAARVIG
jgi:hypothetical protein